MENKKLKVGNVPPLRFPGFEGEWEVRKLGEVTTNVMYGMNAAATDYDGENQYIRITDIDENTRLFYPNPLSSPEGELEDKYLLNNGDILFARTGASVGKSYLYNAKDGKIYFAGFLIRFNVKTENPYFIFSQTLTKKYQKWVLTMSMRSGQPGINAEEYKSLSIVIPSIQEQKKISDFLSLIDERIQTQNKIIEELKLLKNTIRYRLFKQVINQENELVQIKEVLSYEQPTKYLVTNTDYSSDISLIPVLTANKAFVLGYTDEEFGIYDKGQCIIFDDFTMDIKFVNFPFKVKSSAIKILTAKPNVNLKFIFEYLSFLNLSSNEHKRHYISEIEPMEIQLPNYIQQTYVADFLSSINDKIKTEFEIHMLLIKQKQYLLANLFI
ncbi:restriction endonuclease subunit S [Elizabethkingia meningoseptica]|uniref:restriction endonuclease subunit S n=1 Tax=Elizabethkingia meningoseptica TaxID=238 RepID=UPI000AA24E36|nr:restriction endonuclease subunit S [Elizabethkingia meningoseptica]